MTVSHMRAVMPASEEDRWMQLEGVDPWGQVRDDLRTAHQSAHIAALLGAKRLTGGPFTAEDFVLKFTIPEPKTVEQTEEEKQRSVHRMEQRLLMWARAHNARWYTQHPDQDPAFQLDRTPETTETA
jgi:hypothetical protein